MSDNLERTARLYEDILETERVKQRAIVASEAHALADVVAREERLVRGANELEAERLAIRHQLAQRHEALGPTSRLADLIALLEPPQRDELAARRQHLLDLAAQINDVNRMNFQLLRCSIELTGEILDAVFGAAAEPDTYTPGGRQEPRGHDATRVDQVL
ncbi:MAG: flagellar protein FlgN [Candidatus Brocadiia bacterium]